MLEISCQLFAQVFNNFKPHVLLTLNNFKVV